MLGSWNSHWCWHIPKKYISGLNQVVLDLHFSLYFLGCKVCHFSGLVVVSKIDHGIWVKPTGTEVSFRWCRAASWKRSGKRWSLESPKPWLLWNFQGETAGTSPWFSVQWWVNGGSDQRSERLGDPYSRNIFPMKNGEPAKELRIEFPNHLIVLKWFND